MGNGRSHVLSVILPALVLAAGVCATSLLLPSPGRSGAASYTGRGIRTAPTSSGDAYSTSTRSKPLLNLNCGALVSPCAAPSVLQPTGHR